MKDEYPYVSKENFELHLTYDECILYLAKKSNDTVHEAIGMKEYNRWTLSTLTSRYFLLCDGKSKHKDIVSKLNVAFEMIGDSILEGLINIDAISCSDCEVNSNEIFVTGSLDSSYPSHMSIELTDYCNLRCKHCYLSASPKNIAERSFEDVVKTLYKLKNNGVKSIELTGGECTTYSKFKEVLKVCAKEFHLVAVVSNGYLIGEDKSLAEYISSFNNVCVQISVDGLKEFHDEFRNKEKSFEYACKAIEYLKENNTIVRMGSVIVKGNLYNIEDLYNLAKMLKVDAWSTSPVSLYGRGKNISNKDDNNEIELVIKEKLEKYKGDKIFEANIEAVKSMIENREINCGAGWKSFTLNIKSGKVRTCSFLSDIINFGDIYNDDYNRIFSVDKTSKYKNTPNPSEDLLECADCKYIENCKGCFANAFEVVKNEYPNCPWKKAYLDGVNI